ncbi:LysR family transcriptional regulator [Streptomyces decoyicus]|uniref:LysR family transcriptional regulator n=1 Tax=Streptomyces decoyicus TaxID=249567 RepID=UPI0036676DA5
MEIRTIRYFLTVVDTGSLSAASRALHVAQPSLSVTRHLRRWRGRGPLTPISGSRAGGPADALALVAAG